MENHGICFASGLAATDAIAKAISIVAITSFLAMICMAVPIGFLQSIWQIWYGFFFCRHDRYCQY
jgi:hypothetical protein